MTRGDRAAISVIMATLPEDPPFDIREQLARIDKIADEIQKLYDDSAKVRQETKLAPLTVVFTGLGAGAALFAAGGAFVKIVAG